jgi:hypothetical protein
MTTLDAMLADIVARVLDEKLAKLATSSASPTFDPLVSCRDVGVPRKTWIAACRTGALPAKKIGRELRARRSDVDAWIASLPNAKSETKPAAPEHDERTDPLDRALARGKLRAVRGGQR